MARYARGLSTVVVAACAATLACSGQDNKMAQNTPADTSAASTAASTTATSAGETATPMSDANILAAMHEANTAEIAAAEIAAKKASAASVKSFARRMIREHRAMDAAGTATARSAQLTPQPATNDSLPQHAAQEKVQLDSAASGPAFDRAYMDDQVADHQTVLSLLQQAQGGAQNAAVKAAVADAITKVQAHLDLAKKVQGDLKPTA